MRSTRSSYRAVLRGSVAALTALPFLVQSSLGAVTSFHGEKMIKHSDVPPSQVLVHNVKTPRGGNDNNTTTPIKHVIIIVGENRSFDHLYGTYVSPSGDSVKNILSEGIVNADGTPGPNFRKAAQMQASDTDAYSVSPTITGPYKKLPAPNLAFTPESQSYAGAPWVSTEVAGQ
ncbi:MAG TPA: alkaline phosphatase family protein [Rhizomicrobium sp.]|nr:alkaline phosphatase family protein [Rhizomicrobium sp.]